MDLPRLYGLVLAGGQSKRLGQDKGSLRFHGCDQRNYCFNLLRQVCRKAFLSCRQDQRCLLHQFPYPSLVIPDQGKSIGPAGGLLAAHAFAPHCAWLVLACDFPMINIDALITLMTYRSPHRDAIVYFDPRTGIHQPLIAIWEPKGIAILKEQVELGQYSPRKALGKLRYDAIVPLSLNMLVDVDIPQDIQRIQNLQH